MPLALEFARGLGKEDASIIMGFGRPKRSPSESVLLTGFKWVWSTLPSTVGFDKPQYPYTQHNSGPPQFYLVTKYLYQQLWQ